MPRTQPAQQTATEAALQQAKRDLLTLQPQIVEIKERLKLLNKEKKGHLKVLQEHMAENNIQSMEVGEYVIELKESETCPFNEKNLKEILEDHSVLDRYKETFTTTRSGYKMSKN